MSGADLITAAAYGSGHATGTADSWVFGLRRPIGSSFHPTEQGMRAVAERIVTHLERDQGGAA